MHKYRQTFLDYLVLLFGTPGAVLAADAVSATDRAHISPGRGRYDYRKSGKLFNTTEIDDSYKWASGGDAR